MMKKFFLADDDIDDRQIFEEALASIDPKIVCEGATDGKQALSLLSNVIPATQPSIIFLDINMPIMNGWDVLRKLRTEQKFDAVPVIMYTTSSGVREKLMAEELGASCFVTKPDSFRILKNMLEIVVRHIESQTSSLEMCKSIHRMLAAR